MQPTHFLSPAQSVTLQLRAGTAVRCVAGQLWLTRECPALRGASPDILLEPGEQHRMPADGRAFVHAWGPHTARYALVPVPGRAPGWLARASAWIHAATRRTSSRGAGSACSSQ